MNSRVFYTLIRLAVVCAALGLAAGCDDVSTAELKTPVYKTGLKDSDDNKTSAFRKDFPLQAASYDRNNESTFMSKYKGSVNFMKNDDVDPLPEGYKQAAQPYLKNLWLGYPFMYEYREARGHTYAIHDILEIDRINRYGEKGGMPATCWNCKTPKMVQWIKQYGDDFWAKDFNQFRTEVTDDDSIGCATCHNAETMQLQLYSEPLKDYLKSVGKDPAKLPRSEMRSLVCAQCHVEYYFNDPGHGPTKRPVFPWKNGFTPEAIYSVYEDNGNVDMPGFKGKFADWVHPVSQTPMLKMQHPDYETWIDGPHGAAGVACADCHMPYQREEGKKMSSHWWTSPLRDPELRACRQCHADKTAAYLRGRIEYTQDKTYKQLLVAQEYSVRAHEAVRLALEYTGEKPADYDQLIIRAKEAVRKGQMFWDFVSAENRVWFHNPAKALDTLTSSITLSQDAINAALKATNYGIAPKLEGDIKQIVPPILKMSRKLQQDPEYLKTHPWFAYLKPLPKADQMWEGNKKIQ